MRGHLKDEIYCGNYTTKVVHDITREKTECQLKGCIENGEDIPFESLELAEKAGYKKCGFCLP